MFVIIVYARGNSTKERQGREGYHCYRIPTYTRFSFQRLATAEVEKKANKNSRVDLLLLSDRGWSVYLPFPERGA